MKVVYKYELQPAKSHNVVMPVGAEVLTVHEQEDKVFVWALVDTDVTAKEVRSFWAAPTGMEVPKFLTKADYIGSVFMYRSSLIFHIFDVTAK